MARLNFLRRAPDLISKACHQEAGARMTDPIPGQGRDSLAFLIRGARRGLLRLRIRICTYFGLELIQIIGNEMTL